MSRNPLSDSRRVLRDGARVEGYVAGYEAGQVEGAHCQPSPHFSIHVSLRGNGGASSHHHASSSNAFSSREKYSTRKYETEGMAKSGGQTYGTHGYEMGGMQKSGSRKYATHGYEMGGTQAIGSERYSTHGYEMGGMEMSGERTMATYGSSSKGAGATEFNRSTKHGKSSKHRKSSTYGEKMAYGEGMSFGKGDEASAWADWMAGRLESKYYDAAMKELDDLEARIAQGPFIYNTTDVLNYAKFRAYKRQCKDQGKQVDISPPPIAVPTTVTEDDPRVVAAYKATGYDKFLEDEKRTTIPLLSQVDWNAHEPFTHLTTGKSHKSSTHHKSRYESYDGYLPEVKTARSTKTEARFVPYPSSDSTPYHSIKSSAIDKDHRKIEQPMLNKDSPTYKTVEKTRTTRTFAPGGTYGSGNVAVEVSSSSRQSSSRHGGRAEEMTWRGGKGGKHPDPADAMYQYEMEKRGGGRSRR